MDAGQDPGRAVAHGRTGAPGTTRLPAAGPGAVMRQSLGRQRWWVQVGIVWLVARLGTTVATLAAAAAQEAVHGLPAHPGYFAFASIWDADYYRSIHDNGYPQVLPRDPDGTVQPNVWAFLPGFPALVRLLTAVTGLRWDVVAPSVSLLASLALALVTYRLFVRRLGAGAALAGVAFLCAAPASPILQFAYAESLALLLVALFLWCLERQRHLLAILPALAAGLARPLAAPLAATAVAMLALAIRERRADGRWPTASPWWGPLALAVITVAGVALWPAVAALVTGEPQAYLLTEAAWWGGTGQLGVSMFLIFLVGALGAPLGVTAAVLLVVGAAAMMGSRPVRRLGAPMWAWTGAYLGYLILLAPIDSATPRLLLGAFPLAGAAALVVRRPVSRAVLLVVLLALQVAFLFFIWRATSDGSPHP